MRALLTTLNAKYIHTNLAIRLLYEINCGCEDLDWKEFTIKSDKKETAKECAEYELVAFSCYIWNITHTLEVARMIKHLNPHCVILLGGPEVSYEFDDLILLPYIDYIICGEGEISFTEFLNNYPAVEKVPGLVWKESGVVRSNPQPAAYDVNLFSNSMPYRFDDPEELRNKVLYIETSRGCPYKCEFCLASLDNKVRYLPQQCIHETLLYLMKHGRTIKFLDRTFNMKRDFTIGVFQFILDNFRPGNVFQFEITADILHPDIIRFIDEKVPPGLFRFEIGIQSVNRDANLAVKRKQDFSKTTSIINQVRHKVELHLDLIVGLPYDTKQDIRHGFGEVFKLFPPELQLGFLKFLKGTPMRDKHEHGYVFDNLPPYEIIRSKYLSEDDLSEIRLLENALEIYWNGRRTINLLKYISQVDDVFNFLVGLGKHFIAKCEPHKYTMDQVYNVALEFLSACRPDDVYARQLLAIDYYTYFKVFPKAFIINPVRDGNLVKVKNERTVLLPVDFDFDVFSRTGEFIAKRSLLRLTYNRETRPVPVSMDEPALAH
jgi:anaerobic magnesium-protoporphyrin IX monomethyl ester cyclase